MSVTIKQGDCREVLRTLPAGSVQCCVTSPPYFGLRDYGVDGQIGLEPTPDAFIAAMVEVFRCVRDVLADDGTLWLNIGDSYARTGGSDRKPSPTASVGNTLRSMEAMPNRQQRVPGGLKEKDLIGIPWMLAFALRADGWWLRSHIIWHKPNPMPESVTDRPTSSHESIFLMSKAARYFYDGDAVREAYSPSSAERYKYAFKADNPSAQATKNPSVGGGMIEQNDVGRNLRNVWTVPSQPFSGAHFATFPPALIEPCIKAGSRPDDTVLDPFGGAGTTGLVADRLNRNAILIELNPAYADMARNRLFSDAPLFAEIA